MTLVKEKISVIGCGSHFNSVFEVICNDFEIKNIFDPFNNVEKGEKKFGIKLLNYKDLSQYISEGEKFFIAVGDNIKRQKYFNDMLTRGFVAVSCIDQNAYFSQYARIGVGSIVMPGAAVRVNAKIGLNCIVNTGSIVEHDTVVGNHCHIAPGAVLCGSVKIEDGSLIGANSTVLPGAHVQSKLVKSNTLYRR